MSADRSSDRREFLQRLAIGGAALGALPSLLNAATAPSVSPLSAAAMLREPVAQDYDVSWPKKLTGKHKAVFDSPDIDGGLGVLRAGVVPKQYVDAFKLAAGDFTPVLVLRHFGIHLAMNPTYWATYGIGKKFNVKHPLTEQPIDINPALLRESDGVPAMFAELALDKQIARGTIVLGCALAFGDVVDLIANADKLAPAAAESKAKSMLMPGIVMQPSGVFATTLAQEHGCAYVRAT